MSANQIIRERVSAASVAADYQLEMPLLFDDPVGPRTRRRSQHTISRLRMAMLRLIREYPLLNGDEINELYSDVWKERGFPKAKFDSPRKRAGELAADGLLLVAGERDGGRTFIISAAGLDVVTR